MNTYHGYNYLNYIAKKAYGKKFSAHDFPVLILNTYRFQYASNPLLNLLLEIVTIQ